MSIDEALELLQRPGAVVLAGGTGVNARPPGDVMEVVDLQALGLDGIEPAADGTLLIGATTTLQHLAGDDQVPTVVREAARRELPSTLRAQATIGGCIAAGDAESELLAGLLVHEAMVETSGPDGVEDAHLERVLADLPLSPERIITAVSIRTSGRAAATRTARTCADRAIVAAYVRDDGSRLRMALTGVASTPLLVDGTDDLHPPGDFRGSSEYRHALAVTLLARAREALA